MRFSFAFWGELHIVAIDGAQRLVVILDGVELRVFEFQKDPFVENACGNMFYGTVVHHGELGPEIGLFKRNSNDFFVVFLLHPVAADSVSLAQLLEQELELVLEAFAVRHALELDLFGNDLFPFVMQLIVELLEFAEVVRNAVQWEYVYPYACGLGNPVAVLGDCFVVVENTGIGYQAVELASFSKEGKLEFIGLVGPYEALVIRAGHANVDIVVPGNKALMAQGANERAVGQRIADVFPFAKTVYIF